MAGDRALTGQTCQSCFAFGPAASDYFNACRTASTGNITRKPTPLKSSYAKHARRIEVRQSSARSRQFPPRAHPPILANPRLFEIRTNSLDGFELEIERLLTSVQSQTCQEFVVVVYRCRRGRIVTSEFFFKLFVAMNDTNTTFDVGFGRVALTSLAHGLQLLEKRSLRRIGLNRWT